MNIADILKQPEGRRLEFKKSLPTVADLAKTIIAFSNDAGGELYIGIQDNPREVLGLPEDELLKLEERISNIIHDDCTPIIGADISFIIVEDKHLVKVTVYRGSNLPYYLKVKGKMEGTYLRVGSSNRLASPEMIAELERQKWNISFDSEMVHDYKINLTDFSDFDGYYQEQTNEKLNMMTLRKLELIKSHQKQEQQTELTSSVHGLIQLVGTKLGLSWDQVGTKLGPSWDPVIQILEYCINPRSIPEIMNVVQWTNRTKFRNKYIILFLELGLLEMTQPDKPKSSKQQYYLTESGKSFLDGIKDRL